MSVTLLNNQVRQKGRSLIVLSEIPCQTLEVSPTSETFGMSDRLTLYRGDALNNLRGGDALNNFRGGRPKDFKFFILKSFR